MCDPEYAAMLHPNNTTYILRAIEVKELTGKSKRSFGRRASYFSVHMECPVVQDRNVLYERIDTRVVQMIDE